MNRRHGIIKGAKGRTDQDDELCGGGGCLVGLQARLDMSADPTDVNFALLTWSSGWVAPPYLNVLVSCGCWVIWSCAK